jgi:glycerol-3-phosphate O-acyltransferase
MEFISQTPLWNFDSLRSSILSDVSARSEGEILSQIEGQPQALDLMLGEALYSERLRLRRTRPNWFTKQRFKDDRALWSQVQSGLLSSPALSDRKQVLKQILNHYGEEIGGRFNPKIYEFATHAVPWGFSWLLNAASHRTFMPWKMREEVHSRLRISGEIPSLQKLSQKGTVLLVPTHLSNVDSVLIGYIISLMQLPPFAYGAGLNLFSNPALSFFMSNLGAYTVDRQKNNPIYKATLKNYSTRILKEGVHSIFFPGGGRSRSGAMEKKLKLGLLGTGLEAQIENMKAGKPNPKIFVVPMVMSYHFVLEASSLIEDFLLEAGKHRYIITDDESWQPIRVAKFFWKIFASQSAVDVRVGKAMDVFGNLVDDEGQSIGPNGTTIDPARWLTTAGVLGANAARDQEYTRMLGSRISERYHVENTVLSSHLVAFSLFETLRAQYPLLDLYRFLRLTPSQRSIPVERFLSRAEFYHQKVIELAERGKLHLSEELRTSDVKKWVKHGLDHVGVFHENRVVYDIGDAVTTDDMNLLYYYRNRLAGYGLYRHLGKNESKGFLE